MIVESKIPNATTSPKAERFAGLALAVWMLAGLLVGCGDRPTSPVVSPARASFNAASRSYTITALPAPISNGSGNGLAFAINEAGDVAGRVPTPAGPTHASRWIRGVYQDLGSLGGESEGRGINATGDVVGVADVLGGPNGQTHAVLWTRGTMVDLGTLGGVSSEADGINARGQVVGWAQTASGLGHAFLWQNGVMTDLDPLGTGSVAYAINDAGQVVGFTDAGDHSDWALWERGRFTDLGLPGVARGINNAGDVVGISLAFVEGAHISHAFLLKRGVATDLGTLGQSIRESSAFGINARGQVVGSSGTLSGLGDAFVWENGVMSDLGSLNGLGSDGRAINASGQIVGGSASVPNHFEPTAAVIWRR